MNNSFLKDKETEFERLFLSFLSQRPKPDDIDIVQGFDYSPDQIEIIENNVYGYCAGKFHKCKYSNTFFENKLKVRATTRNWKTVLKILEMLG